MAISIDDEIKGTYRNSLLGNPIGGLTFRAILYTRRTASWEAIASDFSNLIGVKTDPGSEEKRSQLYNDHKPGPSSWKTPIFSLRLS